MAGIQLLAIAFAVTMVYWTYQTFRRRDLAAAEAALWLAVWIGLILVSAFPDVLRNVVGPLRVARLLDLVMIVALLLLSTLVFVLNSRVRHMERRTVELVRRLALSAEDADGKSKQPVGQVQRDPNKTAD